MVTFSNKAAVELKEQLINKCFETGIGFRMLVKPAELGEGKFIIKLDKQRKGDEVIDLDGVRVFVDPMSITRISDYQLDYEDEPGGGFYLKTTQEA